MNNFEYALPEKLQDVFGYLNEPGSLVKAGGIDLLDMMKERLIEPKRLVNIRALPELRFVNKNEDGGLSIGPGMTLAELSEHSELQKGYQALAQAASGAATPQIRNAATLGGNLCQRPRCWYFRSQDFDCLRKGGDACFAIDGENQHHAIFGNSDGCVIVHPSATAVALTALDAKLKITSEESEREIAITDFFVPPAQDITRENILKQNEIITEVILPPQPQGSVSFYFKQKEKQAFDWPIADVAVAMTLKGKKCVDARVVLGSAAPVPWRVPKAERVLKNKTLSVQLAKTAATEALRDANPLSENAYKVAVFKAIVYRSICWAGGIDPFA